MRRWVLGAVATVCVLGAGILAYARMPDTAFALSAARCDRTEEGATKKIDCWFNLLEQSLKSGGVPEAMRHFSMLHETYAEIANPGECHSGAHRLGDLAYYERYLSNPDFNSIEIPPEATVCTFGFFHGFFEHLFQDNPRSEFITETCAYFERRFASTVGSMRHQCYHGAGHGLMLASAERVPKAKWGVPAHFLKEPLDACVALPEATERDVNECRQGVFTVLMQWLSAKQYDLAVPEDPFSLCGGVAAAHRSMCYNQVADRYFGEMLPSVEQLLQASASIQNPALRAEAFRVGVMAYALTLKPEAHAGVLEECARVAEPLKSLCVRSVPQGIMNAGFADEQYPLALALCRSEAAHALGVAQECFVSLQQAIDRYYAPDTAFNRCADVPEEWLVKECRELRTEQLTADARAGYWEEKIRASGGANAYEQLAAAALSRTLNDQHAMAHAFGEALYRTLGLGGISACDTRFAYGCWHEFTARAILEEGIGAAKRLHERCEGDLSCEHGIGHGLIAYGGYTVKSLRNALAKCNELPSADPSAGCRSGIFMEYTLRSMLAEGGQKFDANRPFGDCAAVEARDAPMCFFSLPTWWQNTGPWEAYGPERIASTMAAWCEGAPDADTRRSCVGGIGRVVVDLAAREARAAKRLCQTTFSEASDTLLCLTYAANILGTVHSAPEGEALCAGYDGIAAEYCLRQGGAIFSILVPPPLPPL